MKYGRYEILKELGRGSMGVVYEAHDPQIDRIVALKVLRQDRHASDAFVRRFLKEAKAIGRLSHSNIVTVHDVGEDQGTIYIAMEFLEGRPLNEVIEEKRFGFEEVLDLGIQIAETLDYAHGKGVVHRDIKPSNILVQPRGRIKITDFGIAHIEDPSATLQTQDGEILGTPAYMSPEQVLGKPVDGRSDLFSLGVILYELSTGTRPFGRQGKTLATLFNEITNTVPPEPTELNSALDPRLSRVIMKCLAKDPRERYATGEALADALRECRGTETVVMPPTPVSVPEPAPSGPSRTRLPLLALLVTLGLGAAVAFLYPGALDRITEWLWKPRPVQMATLKADSLPEGAELWVDGSLRGRAPLEIQLGLGKHSMRAVAPGYEEWTETLDLAEPGAHSLKIELRRKVALAFLRVESTPPGAMLSVNGISEGRTPIGLELPLGEHRVALSLEDHEEWNSRIELSEEKEYTVTAGLKPVTAVRQAVLKVETDPVGAEILVNGELKGRGPAEVTLPTGRYLVALRLEGHLDWSEEMDLEEARKYPVVVRLQPVATKARLSVRSDPPGAEVQVDGSPLGRTPVSAEFATGVRRLRVFLPGYQEHAQEVRLDEPREYAFDLTLQRLVREGSLRIETNPAGADVFLNGEPRGVTPFELKIPPGDHIVKLRLENHEEWQQRFRVEDGQDLPLSVDLQPVVKESILSLTSAPSSASVFVDGASKGKTPVRLRLPPGDYRVQLKLRSYKDWETRVQLVEAREYPLKATLTKEDARSRPTTQQEPTRRPGTSRTPPPEQPPANDWGIGTYRDRRINE
jgi:serine/threonine-protein kinase